MQPFSACEFMSIPEDKLAELRAFGYTEVEARFLYLVATHSGYFTLRQFLDFAHAKSGKRNARLVEKLFGLGHASARRYTRRSLFQLRSRRIYAAIGKNHLRNRREHELPHIKARLLALDFILAHPQERSFETAWEKHRYFIERFKVEESLFSLSGPKGGRISFSDRFPCVLPIPRPNTCPWSPSPTLTLYTEISMATSLTCAHIGPCSGDSPVSNSFMSPRLRACRTKPQSCFPSLWKARVSRI